MSNAAPQLQQLPFDFAQFLVDRDAITAEQAAEVRRRAAKEYTPIGQLLMQSRFLTPKQVMAVLRAQADQPTVRFGQLAVELGLLTTRQLEDALRLQRSTRKHMIEIVHSAGYLPPNELLEVVAAYVSVLEMTMSHS